MFFQTTHCPLSKSKRIFLAFLLELKDKELRIKNVQYVEEENNKNSAMLSVLQNY